MSVVDRAAPPPGATRAGLSWMLYACGLAIALALAALVRLGVERHGLAILACAIVAGAAYAGAMRIVPRAGGAAGDRRTLAIVLAVAALARAALVTAPPALSTDVYRYIWEGRVQRFGINPYLHPPDDPALVPLRTDAADFINAPWLPTPYPPVAQLFFRLVSTISESVLAYRLAFLAADALVVVALLRWLALLEIAPLWVVAYAWNPLVILENADGAHVDVLGVLLLVLAAVALARRRSLTAAIWFALAIGVKFVPAILAPLFWRRVRVRDVAAGAAVLAASYLPFIGGGRLPTGSLFVYLQQWRFNGPGFRALAFAVGPSRATMLAVAAGVAAAIVFRPRRLDATPAAWAWPIAVTLLFAPALFPWYLLWLTPFAFAPANLALAAWSVAAVAMYALWQAWTTGPLPVWYQAAEYGIVAAVALLTLTRRVQPPAAVRTLVR